MPTEIVTTADDASPALASWEILSVVTSCFIAEWVVLAFVGNNRIVGAIPVTLALALMIFSHCVRHETLKDIGFRFDNFVPAVRLLLLPTLIAVGLIVLAGWLNRNHQFAIAPLRLRFLAVPLWALFQQYALQGFINRRAQLVLGAGSKSIFLVAVIFSLMHLPNPLLGAITLLGGFVWAAIYQRQPNLYALALSHTIISVILALSLSQNLVYNLRVGLKYFG